MFRGKLHFLVKWEGYGYEENKWVREEELNAPDLLREFYQKNPGAPRRVDTPLMSSRRQSRRGVM
jgi:hypothetical protein